MTPRSPVSGGDDGLGCAGASADVASGVRKSQVPTLSFSSTEGEGVNVVGGGAHRVGPDQGLVYGLAADPAVGFGADDAGADSAPRSAGAAFAAGFSRHRR